MKKILYRLAMLFFLAALVPSSCDLLEDCKTCKLKTDDNGSVTYGTGVETCGDELADREAEEPVTVGNVTTSWVCE